MAGETTQKMDTQVEQDLTDPWAAAFAALDKKDEATAGATAVQGADGSGGSEVDGTDSEEPDEGGSTAEIEGQDSLETQGNLGGPGDLGEADSTEDGGFDWDGLDISEEGVKSYREELMQNIEERTIRDVAAAYIKQGARNTDGRLGATINDEDVCKRDRDGVPRFYNPETGREFTGDNPRRQAQEWVDDYNNALRDAFNQTCQQYSQQLLQKEGGRLAVIEFAPTYRKLDPVRRVMFESIIEDYEMLDDDGNIVGYSCDLNKAMAAVDRQVAVIRKKFANQAGAQAKPTEPTGPALDTPSVGHVQRNASKPQFHSIAEAMEWEQDQILARAREKKGH